MGKRILISGGSGGIGQLIGPLLDARGYDILSTSSKELDVTDHALVGFYLREHLPDIVINLSVISIDNLLAKTTDENVRKQLNVNVLGNINLIKNFSQISKDRNYGRYIYMSSILSESPVAGAALYSASKAFNDHLIQVAAKENARYHTTFNSIQLGYFAVGLCGRLVERIKEVVLAEIPLKRFGKPEELVNLIEFIIETEYATGSSFKLAGGL